MVSLKKAVFILILIPFICIILHPKIAYMQEKDGPEMVLEENLFDAKEIKEGSIIEHRFKVKNVGKGPLEIKKVSPG